jgi:tetratricopeptide (TPR) repeat protein
MRTRTPLSPSRLLPLSAAAAVVAALLAGGCTQYKSFDSIGYLRQQYAQQVGAAEAGRIEIPFELNPEIRAELEKIQRLSSSSELRRINQVTSFIFDGLDLKYELRPTRNAVATYHTRKGNCLSFVNLFVGVARERGLSPFYVEVTDYQKWNHREGMVVSQGHIVGGLYLDGILRTFDFLPDRRKAYKEFKPIDDLTAAAHYYNNLGGEALMEGDLETARGYLETATRIAPDFEKAINNMGVVLARGGEPERALELYRRGLEVDPENATILTNMTRAYQQLGRSKEAEDLLARIEATNTTNPFFFVYQGEMALSRGDNRKALEYMTKALRQDSEVAEVHVGFVKVYMALGEMDKARHHLERALKLDATHDEATLYARLMGRTMGK